MPTLSLPRGKGRFAIQHSTKRINIWTGAVRSSKTVSSLFRWIHYVTEEAPPGDLVIIGKTVGTAHRNIIGPIQEIVGYDNARTGRAPGGEHVIYIRGRMVYIIGANDERAEPKIRGWTLAGAYGDEITTWPQSFFKQLLFRMSVEGAKFFGTTNPDNPRHWLKVDYIDRRAEIDARVFHFRLEDNPFLAPAYVEALRAEYTGLWFLRFVLGKWVAAEGAIFDMLDEKLHFVDELPSLVRHWMAVDYGTTNPTVWAYLSLGVDGRLYVHRAYRYDSKKSLRQKTDAEYSRDMIDHVLKHAIIPESIFVDPSAASFRVQLWRDIQRQPGTAGIRVRLADNEVAAGIRETSSLLSAGMLRFHRPSITSEMWDELAGYSWDAKAQQRGEDKPIKADDHDPDMIRYAVRGTRAIWRPRLMAK